MEKMVPQNIPLLPSDIQKTIGLYLILPSIVFPGSRAPYTVLLAKNNNGSQSRLWALQDGKRSWREGLEMFFR